METKNDNAVAVVFKGLSIVSFAGVFVAVLVSIVIEASKKGLVLSYGFGLLSSGLLLMWMGEVVKQLARIADKQPPAPATKPDPRSGPVDRSQVASNVYKLD